MDTRLNGRVVLVTGASGGIGSAICRGFAAEGARVILHFRAGRNRVEALQRELDETERFAIRADLRNESEVRRLFKKGIQKFGRIDILVVNAGAWETKDLPLHNMSLRQWRQTVDGVLTSAFLSVREFLRVVARQKRGNVVLIGSTAAVFGEAGHADYAAGKAALAYGLTRSLKNEMARLAPHTRQYCGGRINCICPGWTLVPRTAAMIRQKDVVRRITSTMALPQIARPEDIAHAAVFLSSDWLARHITGQILTIAGGMEGRQLWRPEEVDPGLV